MGASFVLSLTSIASGIFLLLLTCLWYAGRKKPKGGGTIAVLAALNHIATIRTWAMFMAGPFLLLFAAWLVWIVAFAGWPNSQAPRQLDILGKALWIVLVLNGVIIVALASAKVLAKSGGSSVEISSDTEHHEPPAQVVTTTTTEVKP